MAESSSNSSTTSTSGAGSSASTTSTNSGAAASGSQSSSNGSTGNNGNGNTGPGLSFSAAIASNTGSGWTSNSNGNFGGGGGNFGGGGPKGTTTGFTGFASDNFGQGWGGPHSISPDSEGKHTIKPNAEGKHVVTQKYSKPQSQALYMTVDEVYGKGNQSIVESQGDYDASSNEKSNVETSTFGKQDEISVTPLSVTEDKGLVNNDAIQSVEGLNFQQKDKANQEVMEAKKSRDDAEAEDNANGMRNQLKAVAEKDAEKDNNAFQVGEETNSKEKAAFIEAEKAYKDIEAKVAEKEAELAKAEEEFNDLGNTWFDVHQPRFNAAKDALNDVIAAATRDNEENGKTGLTYDISYLAEVAANPEDYAGAAKVAEQLNDVPGLQGNKYLSNIKQCVEDVARVSKDFYEASQKYEEAQQRYNQLTYELADLMGSKEKAEIAYNKAKKSYGSNFIAENPGLPPGVKEVPLEEPEVTYDEAKESKELVEEATKPNELPPGVEVVLLDEPETGDRAAKTKADEAAKAYKDLQAQADSRLAELNAAANNRSKAQIALLDANKNTAKKADFNDLKSDGTVTLSDGNEITQFTYVGKDPDVKAAYDARKEAIQNLVKADRTYVAKKSEYDSYVNAVNNAKAQADNEAKESKELPAGVEITQLENEQENNASRLDEINNEADQLKESLDKEDTDYQAKLANNKQLDAIGQKIQEFGQRYQEIVNEDDGFFGSRFVQSKLDEARSEIVSFCEQLGVDAPALPKYEWSAQGALGEFQSWEENFRQENFEGLKDFSPDSIAAYKAGVDKAHLQRTQELAKSLDAMAAEAKALENRQKELPGLIADAKKKSEEAPTVTEEAPTVETETPTTEAPSYKANIEAARNEINNSKDLTDEQKTEANTVLGNVESAADAMNKAANDLATNPNDINAVQQYVEETARYNKALKDAKGDKTLKNTDFNKTFTEAVAAANDFDVTMPDGSTKNYAEFATEMVTKSPELAKGLYEAKAEQQEKGGHKVLAAINRTKAKMVMTWLGSKFTFADNQVRSQFNQMAKTDMRATYAAYNNVLNDETGKYSEAEKAEASAAINQANSLMVASAALQASTGFFSGIGDSTSDGEYGKTKPGDLNSYQKALNAASNFAKIALGLGVTPGANEAYQNMYYMAGAKVNESGLFGRDFDGDGFALCQEYGNNAAVGMIAGTGELATAVALMFNPATSKMGINLAIDAVQTFFDALYGVQKEVNKSIKLSNEILGYFGEAKSIAAETGNKEATGTIDSAIKQIEDFQLKSDEVGNLDNWLEGSGSNTVDNGKFNQALSYDEWLKLIEADPVMQEYAKSLNR